MIVIDKDDNKVLDEAYNTILNKGFPYIPLIENGEMKHSTSYTISKEIH